MNVVSYYKPLPLLVRLGLTQMHWTFWTDGIGKALPSLLSESVDYVKLCSDYGHYSVKSSDYDVAYCHIYAIPDKRPAKFIYTFVSDYRGHEKELADWIAAVRPNLLCCLQDMPFELVEYCKSMGCVAKFLPWFVLKKEPYLTKELAGMCTGCIAPQIYPRRTEIYNYLAAVKRGDVSLSCSSHFGKYPLSKNEYNRLLKKTKYYLSGGIYDELVPPKYFEAANVGACLVCFGMPMLEKVGFVDGESYIRISRVSEIDAVLDSDRFMQIGMNGLRMVQERHTVWKRAEQILEIYHDRS